MEPFNSLPLAMDQHAVTDALDQGSKINVAPPPRKKEGFPIIISLKDFLRPGLQFGEESQPIRDAPWVLYLGNPGSRDQQAAFLKRFQFRQGRTDGIAHGDWPHQCRYLYQKPCIFARIEQSALCRARVINREGTNFDKKIFQHLFAHPGFLGSADE